MKKIWKLTKNKTKNVRHLINKHKNQKINKNKCKKKHIEHKY